MKKTLLVLTCLFSLTIYSQSRLQKITDKCNEIAATKLKKEWSDWAILHDREVPPPFDNGPTTMVCSEFKTNVTDIKQTNVLYAITGECTYKVEMYHGKRLGISSYNSDKFTANAKEMLDDWIITDFVILPKTKKE